ncbi:MAG: response regulator [Chthoniobacteraceae bacterium]
MHKDLFRKAKVLIVDDEPSNVRLLERILEVSGKPETRSTTDPRQTLSLLLELEPDIVLLDLHMPHLDGFAVMELLKAAVPPEAYLPVLILTADITPETKKRAFLAGAKDFVTKPLDHSEVVYRIKNLLENRFLHLELQDQNASLEQQVRIRTAQLEQTLVELRSTQEQVVKQERLRALGMMAGGIAHDFNNALTMMLGYGELLVPYLSVHGSGKEIGYLSHMISAAQDARHVVSRLREFYRPRSAEDERVPVDLNEVVQRAVSVTSPKWKGSSRASGVQINIQTDLAEDSRIIGSAGDLAEVLTNLIFNAVDAMPAGGDITVATRRLDDRVRISVSDSGVGMSETDRVRCLEPFFTTKGEHGTGLGLSVVYGIVQRHGGTIDIASAPGTGTRFDITLPIFTESETRLVQTEQEHEPVGPLRVLVVDDQTEICELIAEYLSADGHESITANNGCEAFDRYCSSDIDLVITDQSMPDMNGVQLAAAIKEKHEDARVILLTGFGDEMIASGSRPDNVDLIVAKPITAAELRRAVGKAARPSRSTI